MFLLPRLFGGGEDNYLDGFKTLAFVADGLVKRLLLSIGCRESKTARALLPVLGGFGPDDGRAPPGGGRLGGGRSEPLLATGGFLAGSSPYSQPYSPSDHCSGMQMTVPDHLRRGIWRALTRPQN